MASPFAGSEPDARGYLPEVGAPHDPIGAGRTRAYSRFRC
jgi:hypothetical protein